MGSPLSAVLAPLYMEMLEEDHYKAIIGDDVTWLRYCDDILAFIPETTNMPQILSDLNSIETAIQFTVEEEQGSKLPFLVLIHRHFNISRFNFRRNRRFFTFTRR